MTFSSGGQLRPATGGGIDPTRSGVLRIIVYGQPLAFRRAAERSAHVAAKAYYNAGRNEVGLLLDMESFRRFYSFYDKQPGQHPGALSAFIAYAMDAFNEDSGHEFAHVYQQQTGQPAYTLPAIREGEAEVQGLTRRRNGLVFNFFYNTPDAWFNGRFDLTVVKERVETIGRAGRPMSPMEVDRLNAMKALHRSGSALSTAQLLGMDTAEFFAGSAADIESRYAQSWALCLLAIRKKQVGQTLAEAIQARVAKAPRADLEAELDRQVARFIDDPHGLLVSRETAWKDAERYFRIDRIFAGLFYMWIHVISPDDMKALIYIGDALFAGRNLHGAMRYYLAAQQLDGRSALPLLRIGDVHAHVGDGEAALRAWGQAEGTAEGGEFEALYRKQAKERPALKVPWRPRE